jgi:hypothetical protein
MLEVAVAVLVAGLLLGSLTGALLAGVDRSAAAREQLGGMGVDPGDDISAYAWTWGPCLVSSAWRPGPELGLTLRDPRGTAALAVGLWIEGWFQGEWEADQSGSVVISNAAWSGREGCEAVVRLRAAGAAWGPPWRTLVADEEGRVSGLAAGACTDTGTGIVVHPPMAASHILRLSWAAVAPEMGVSLPFFLGGVPAAGVGLAVDGATQSWRMGEGRDLDVYY